MAISLYDISVANYLQTLDAVTGFLAKGEQFARDNNELDLAKIVDTRLRPDMLPFRFQLISVYHHSLGAINGIKDGLFGPPPAMPDLDYAGLQKLVGDAAIELRAMAREDVDGLEGRAIKFKAGKFEIPFTAEHFILSFSLPNFYFHATTAYDMLRIAGVPLGKMDFLGNMRVAS